MSVLHQAECAASHHCTQYPPGEERESERESERKEGRSEGVREGGREREGGRVRGREDNEEVI